ncbi:ribosome recycling factor family protein [Shewanella kaireitica]|uniref:ribosome recycling factor family protein n=1 Tax=Shewanella kaireitica TaxID=212021 RepID=UPI00200E1633|nr:ribosome recycling factor family protein [Shewanella kaireitica]MCL1092821.1 ribosome recycling factor family protein [Shewanella kaireitica]
MNEKVTISLPALIHRIGRDSTNQAKVLARLHSCELKRVRRSRNWAVTGEAMSIQSFKEQLKSQTSSEWIYLTKKLETALLKHADKLEPLSAKLARLISENDNITLAELIHLTDCTLSEARSARFNAEPW